MSHEIPCIYTFITETKEGNRNQHLFKALNHYKNKNKQLPKELIQKEAEKLNQLFRSPLTENEVHNVTLHVVKKNYRSNCKGFEAYCQRCRYGDNRVLYNQINPRYHWHIKPDNTLYGFRGLPDGTFYPWDFEDTQSLDLETKRVVMELREAKGINPLIDQEIIANGLKVGDEALEEYMKYLQGGQ